jgi:hypothetical protein
MIWKGIGRESSWPDSKALPQNFSGGIGETTKSLVMTAGLRANPGLPEYEVGAEELTQHRYVT